jgi:hypothetical protein
MFGLRPFAASVTVKWIYICVVCRLYWLRHQTERTLSSQDLTKVQYLFTCLVRCRAVPNELGYMPGPELPGALQGSNYRGMPALTDQMAAIEDAVAITLSEKKRINLEVSLVHPYLATAPQSSTLHVEPVLCTQRPAPASPSTWLHLPSKVRDVESKHKSGFFSCFYPWQTIQNHEMP